MQRPLQSILARQSGLLHSPGSRTSVGEPNAACRWPGTGQGSSRWWWLLSRPDPGAESERGATTVAAIAVAQARAAEDEPEAQRRRRTEAVLLFNRGPANLRKIAALASLADATEARTRIRQLNELYDRTGSALRIEEVAGGHQLLTRAALSPWLRRMRHVPPPVHLGAAAMETLAIIAYRQPVLRAEIEAIRGVACGELVRQLMQKDLVRICGRSEELGRPYLYGTTPYFLQIFGLKNAAAIPLVAGASIQDNSGDTLANSEVLSEASPYPAPIEPRAPVDLPSSDLSPTDVVTPKESDVSIAPGCVLIDEPANWLPLAPAAPQPLTGELPDAAAVDEDDDDFFEDDDDADEDDEWDDVDDDDEDEDDDDEELEDEWEEVGDDDEAELEDAEEEDDALEEEDDDLDEEDEDEIDEVAGDDEEDEWEDDEDDDDWEEEEEEDEEWD